MYKGSASRNTANSTNSRNSMSTNSNPSSSYPPGSLGGRKGSSSSSGSSLGHSPPSSQQTQINSSNNTSSPNPYAQPFVSSSSSPWSNNTSNPRYARKNQYPPSNNNNNNNNTSRSLFQDDKTRSGWSEGDDSSSAKGVSGSSLLLSNVDDGRSAHPEHWEQIVDRDSTQPSHANSQISTPFESPALAPQQTPDFLDKSVGSISLQPLVGDGDDTTSSSNTLLLNTLNNTDINIHMLSLLYDPPVQGCEIKPYVSVVNSAGSISAVPTDSESAFSSQLDFRWFRGQKRICSIATCQKAANMQCVPCMKNKVPVHLTYFCSTKCWKDSWAQHRQMHQQNKSNAYESIPWNYDDCDEVSGDIDSDIPPSLHCKFPLPPTNIWAETCKDRCYTPVLEDVGRSLRLECCPILKAARARDPKESIMSTSLNTKDLNLGPCVRIDTSPVISAPLPPPQRQLVFTDPSTPINTANTFRTVCYNVLAQIYATRQVYPYTSIWALAWEYRKNLLLREILLHQADIICLQEVQANHFENFFQPNLSKAGYDGIFKRKTRDMGENPNSIDGCATFYKRDRFALMEQYGIEFNEAARQHTANRMQLRRLLRGNIALVLVLEELQTHNEGRNMQRRNRKRRLCITNTHIFWDPEFPDVKLWQTWILCQELEKLVLPRNLPLVLCGDFNSLVESSVYELLSTERVESGEDVFGPTGDPTNLLPAPQHMTHRLPLLSAYATIGEPKFTNYTASFVGVLDYVFFTRTHLRCVACLDVDEESLLRQHTALPSPHYPSDHISLVTTLEFLDS